MTQADLDEQLRIVRFGVHAQDRAGAMAAIRNAFAQLEAENRMLKLRIASTIQSVADGPHGPGGNPNAYNKWS